MIQLEVHLHTEREGERGGGREGGGRGGREDRSDCKGSKVGFLAPTYKHKSQMSELQEACGATLELCHVGTPDTCTAQIDMSH